MRNWFGLRCKIGACPCRFHDTEDGCGGKCVDCGRIVGWITRDELRAIGDRAIERELRR